MKLSNQEQKIVNLMNSQGGKATARDIIRYTNYPSSKIRDLKKKGMNIITEPVEGKNYEMYVIKEENFFIVE